MWFESANDCCECLHQHSFLWNYSFISLLIFLLQLICWTLVHNNCETEVSSERNILRQTLHSRTIYSQLDILPLNEVNLFILNRNKSPSEASLCVCIRFRANIWTLRNSAALFLRLDGTCCSAILCRKMRSACIFRSRIISQTWSCFLSANHYVHQTDIYVDAVQLWIFATDWSLINIRIAKRECGDGFVDNIAAM